MTVRTLGRSLLQTAGTTMAVLGIVAASMFGFHEWADAEATRGVVAQASPATAQDAAVRAGSARADQDRAGEDTGAPDLTLE